MQICARRGSRNGRRVSATVRCVPPKPAKYTDRPRYAGHVQRCPASRSALPGELTSFFARSGPSVRKPLRSYGGIRLQDSGNRQWTVVWRLLVYIFQSIAEHGIGVQLFIGRLSVLIL